jgi:hypothetical protein
MTENPYVTDPYAAPVQPITLPATGYETYEPTTTYDTTDAGATGDSDGPSAKEKASDAADAGKQAATEVAQNAAGQAKDVAQETKKQAKDLIGEARSQLSEQAGVQHKNLVTNLRALADELTSMAHNSENGGTATDLVSQAGDRAHGVADWLDQREPGDLLGEVRTFAQQRPGAFLLGAAVAGIVAGRLTRGAVAAHSDDSSSSATSAPRHQAVDTNGETAPELATDPAAYSAVDDDSDTFGHGSVAP